MDIWSVLTIKTIYRIYNLEEIYDSNNRKCIYLKG